jgi:ABC-type multidrug transport system fused ATPase/permease subunit
LKYLPRVLKYLKPQWKLALASVALILLASCFELLIPWPLKFLVDHVLEDHPLPAAVRPWLSSDRSTLLAAAVIAGFLFVLGQNALTVLDNYVNTRLEQTMVLNFRSDLFRHAQRLSLTFHDGSRAGGLIYAINFQAHAATRLIMTLPPLVQSFLTLVGMFGILFAMEPRIAFASLAVVPLLYACVRHYMNRIEPQLTTVQGLESDSLSIIHEAMSMLRVIVAFGRENHEYGRFRRQGERAVDARVGLTVRQTLFSLCVNMITAGGTALALWLGARSVLDGKLSVGQLLVILSYLALVYKPLETISTTLGSMQEISVALRRSFGLLDTPPEIQDAPHARPLDRPSGLVVFDRVSFRYPSRSDTLREISFEAQPGQVVAVVGPTGAGKTTLMSLLPRFYDPRSGSVLIDGVDVRELQLESLRSQISIVLQEPLLFSGTIADNIRYGRLEASDEEIVEAARAANAHDFISALPQGYETELGERGSRISGGERQRIAVARAFLRNAPILILDEPTSSIDSRTEAVILEALDRLMVRRTTFIIAHRLSTIRRADLILVLDGGRLVQRGTHEQLLAQDGLYRQLHERQTRHADRRPIPLEEALTVTG